MNITATTRVILRMHTEANERGLSLYNQYFESQHLDAIYVLVQNPSVAPLIDGLRKLNFAGANTAGFENDPNLLTLVDEATEEARIAGSAGIVVNRGGQLIAHYQGGEALISSINEKRDVAGLNVALVGAGTMARTFLSQLSKSETKPNITIYNRTLEHAEALKAQYPFVIGTGSLNDVASSIADAIVNTTSLGDDITQLIGVESLQTFQMVVDVTIGTEQGGLVEYARQAGVPYIVTGQDVFTHQAVVVLKQLLDHDADLETLRTLVDQNI